MSSTMPFGRWPSPISSSDAISGGIRFADAVQVESGDIYWVESRPDESGRSALVHRDAKGQTRDVGPSNFDVRTRVHEYGGGAFAVRDGVVFAARFDDQRWYRIEPESTPVAFTPEPPAGGELRYADLTIGAGWAIAVRETHHDSGAPPANDLVRLDLFGHDEPESIASGHDFYAAPRISPDGAHLAFLSWDHPNMPWDGTDLWVADIGPDGRIGTPQHVAGGREESVLQPEWSPDGVLHYVSDRTGWWNVYRRGRDGPEPVVHGEADHAWEPWNFGYRRYTFLADGRIVSASAGATGDRLVVVADRVARDLEIPGSSVGPWLAASGTSIFFVASAYDRPSRLVRLDIDSGVVEEIRAPEQPAFSREYASTPEPIVFETPDGPTHALYYPPAHPEISGPDDERPPLVVTIHGGPTSSIVAAMNTERLFWTSRGFGVVDVDYGGSTGHGRAYRNRLRGRWGEVDVRDCALAADHLAAAGRVDTGRIVIKGGSAGGFTVLMALALHDTFAAGAARYPVTDLTVLAEETHKFESRYLDSLIGPYPEARALYEARSPLTHADQIDAPVLLLQGLEDRVVPPSQPRAMCQALAERSIDVEYIEFPGEGHGFRSAEARTRALEAELSFFHRVLGAP